MIILSKISVFIALMILVFANSALAFSGDGYGCQGRNYIAYDKKNSYDSALFFVFWGGKDHISNPIRVTLPGRFDDYFHGLQCGEESVLVAVSGQQKKTGDRRYESDVIYATVSVTEPSNPKVIKQEKRYTKWHEIGGKYVPGKRDWGFIALDGSERGSIDLPKPTLNVQNITSEVGMEFLLDTDREGNKYWLIFDNSESRSTVRDGYGSIFTRIRSRLVKTNERGIRIKTVEVGDYTDQETVD